MKVLDLHGSREERARQHAQALCQEIRKGAIPFLARANQRALSQALPLPGLGKLYEWGVSVAFGSRMSEAQRRVFEVLAKESGLSFRQFELAFYQPDLLMGLAGLSSQFPVGAVPGCSTVLAFGPATPGGRLYLARNLDYPVVGPWEPRTVVLRHRPSEKGLIPHVSVTSAGVHTSGLTAMNEAGLVLSLHAHLGRTFAREGEPGVSVAERIIESARSLEEAVRIARRSVRMGHWSLCLGSAREPKAVIVELAPRELYVREADPDSGFLVQSNRFRSPELRRGELEVSPGMDRDFEARSCRLEQLCQGSKADLTPERLATFLADERDPDSGLLGVLGNVVSGVTTVQSVVMDPESQTVWVSTRDQSPTSLGPFTEIAREGLRRDVFRPLGDPRRAQAMSLYREAYQTWQSGRPDLEKIEKAAKTLPEDSHLALQCGVMAFKLGRFEQARERLLEALRLPLRSELRDQANLLLRTLEQGRFARHAAARRLVVDLQFPGFIASSGPRDK